MFGSCCRSERGFVVRLLHNGLVSFICCFWFVLNIWGFRIYYLLLGCAFFFYLYIVVVCLIIICNKQNWSILLKMDFCNNDEMHIFSCEHNPNTSLSAPIWNEIWSRGTHMCMPIFCENSRNYWLIWAQIKSYFKLNMHL